MTMERNIYIARNGAHFGPYTVEEVLAGRGTGYLRPEDLGWQPGLGGWVPLARLMGGAAVAGGYAGFWLRALALFIDGLVLAVPVSLLSNHGYGRYVSVPSGLPSLNVLGYDVGVSVGGNGVGWLVTWLYAACMESSRHQATLGKMVLGLCVTDEKGRRLSFGRATGRFFARTLSSMTFGIGFLMAGFTRRRQALHDMVAGCLVLRK